MRGLRTLSGVVIWAGLALFAGAAAAQHEGEGTANPAHGEGTRAAAAIDEHDPNAPHGSASAEHHEPAHHAPPVNWTDFGYKKKDTHGGPLGDHAIGVEARPLGEHEHEEPMAPPFLLAILNFAIFAGLLVKFAGPKIKGYLAGRHDAIKHELAEAARLRVEAETRLSEYSARMARVQGEVDAMIREIRSEADAEKAQILKDATAQAAALKRDAEERIASEIARARVDLEREVVAAAVAAAEKVLREQTTPADQQALFDGFLRELSPKATPPGGTSGGGDTISKGWSV